MTTEEWRPIPGFPGYEVSSLGRVLSRIPYRGQALRELVGSTNGNGYRIVLMNSADGRRLSRYVHHLAAAAFVGERPQGAQVRHLDGDKTNNAASNLQYGSVSENSHDMVRHGSHNNARKTHCPKRHPYSEANTYLNPRGARECNTCRRTREAARAAA